MLTRPMETPTANVRWFTTKWKSRDRLAQRLGDPRRVLDLAVLQQHAELVAAQSRERVAFAQALLQHDADLAHEFVARGVAAGVVDDLELVEVEIHHRVVAALLARARERAIQAMLELAPVDEPGQRRRGWPGTTAAWRTRARAARRAAPGRRR